MGVVVPISDKGICHYYQSLPAVKPAHTTYCIPCPRRNVSTIFRNAWMTASLCRAINPISRRLVARSCRRVAGRRFRPISRPFASLPTRNTPDDTPSDGTEPAWNVVRDAPETAGKAADDSTEEAKSSMNNVQEQPVELKGEEAVGESATELPAKVIDRSPYGSASRRAQRNLKRFREVPVFTPAEWFLERNVRLHEEIKDDRDFSLRLVDSSKGAPDLEEEPAIPRDNAPESVDKIPLNLASKPESSEPATEDENSDETSAISSGDPVSIEQGSESLTHNSHGVGSDMYEIDTSAYLEISAMVLAGLQSNKIPDFDSASKPHLLLHTPQSGGFYYLNIVVHALAKEHNADVIHLDAHDMVRIGEEELDTFSESTIKSLQSLSYDTHAVNNQQETKEVEEQAEDGEDLDDPDYIKPARNRFQINSNLAAATKLSQPTVFTYIANAISGKGNSKPGYDPNLGIFRMVRDPGDKPDVTEETRVNALVEAYLDASETKRRSKLFSDKNTTNVRSNGPESEPVSEPAQELQSADQQPPPASPPSPRTSEAPNLIVQIQDYLELNSIELGGLILMSIHDIVRKRRKTGAKILIIGTTSSEEKEPLTKATLQSRQLDPAHVLGRSMVLPCWTPTAATLFASDEKLRIQSLNIRHLQDMLRRLHPHSYKNWNSLTREPDLTLDSASTFAAGLDEAVWSAEQIHRLATITIGLHATEHASNDLSFGPGTAHVQRALSLIALADASKARWLDADNERERRSSATILSDFATNTSHSEETLRLASAKRAADDKLREIRKTANKHEKKLLPGVVDASTLTTTFADVQAPTATIDTLRTLTSLALVRPDAFTYGVLASDRIPGLLLYGPPGTGKTLLAKAVAKESGATVLEVSGSDVYDMYVGEGEKNVRAIFTLARKLSPCVVFVDEADAIFGSRGGMGAGSGSRTSHRELINQFLKEWDGLTSATGKGSAFLMVATNRPFDLDDAVLRRLPRRILVDLPGKAEREAIFKICLRGEQLGDGVDVAKLAARTKWFSGSDVKNLCVQAALYAVREEMEAASAASTTTAATAPTSSSDQPSTTSMPNRTSSTIPSTPQSSTIYTFPSPNSQYPPKRILHPHHFTKALDEISASVNEDMSSLTAIRKFDERYGDRAGRKKKLSGGYGFGNVSKELEDGGEEEGDGEGGNMVRVKG